LFLVKTKFGTHEEVRVAVDTVKLMDRDNRSQLPTLFFWGDEPGFLAYIGIQFPRIKTKS